MKHKTMPQKPSEHRTSMVSYGIRANAARRMPERRRYFTLFMGDARGDDWGWVDIWRMFLLGGTRGYILCQ